MTDKEFVLSIYPDAVCKLKMTKYHELINVIRIQNDWIGVGYFSQKGAWKDAAERINQNMLEKLES